MSATPTPRPWAIEDDANEQPNIYGSDREWVAIVPHSCLSAFVPVAQANARLIVMAVNHYSEMVEALRRAARALENGTLTTCEREADSIRQLLARLDGAEREGQGV